MRTLALSPFAGLAGIAPLIARVIVGVIMAVHGFQKLVGGPANFGAFLQQLGVPAPTLMAYVVTFVELVGGILLILGLLSRLAALVPLPPATPAHLVAEARLAGWRSFGDAP